MRSLLRLAPALAVALAACDESSHPTHAPAHDARVAPLSVASDGSIPGRYVVTLDWNASASSVALAYGITPTHLYEQLINGFSGAIPDDVVQRIAADPRVLRVSVQRQMKKVPAPDEPTVYTQANATWGLDRIDQRALPLDATYTFTHTGAGVRAYIIDTGIRYAHREFEGRASLGVDVFASDPTDPLLGYDGSGDCDGHGTHVAGTVGGKTWGVAKQVTLVGVRVLNCAGYGSDADVIAGMEWVAKHATLPAVANMSLGDVIPTKTMGTNGPIDDAVKAMVASGVTVVVAAGNGWGNGTVGADACMFPISNVPEAITVGASTRTDARTSWSNYGACIDLFAPGSGVTSADAASDSARSSKSGTSMAAPHVAGAAALVLQQAPSATPHQVRDVLVNGATQNIVTPVTLNSGATPNSHLLYSRAAVPASLTGGGGGGKPCTPKRRREGSC